MYCPKCKRQVLGDICPDCGYKSAFKKMDDLGGTATESPVAVPVVSASTTPIKDKPATSGFKPMDSLCSEAKKNKETAKQNIPASGGFKPMDVLPGGKPEKTTGTTATNTGDVPAAGGFKSMDPFDIPNGRNTNGRTEVPATGGGNTTDPDSKKGIKPENDTKPFSWKRWTPAAIVAVIAIILMLLILPGSNGSTYEQALDNKIDTEHITGENLALSYQYTNAILDSIEYRVLKEDKSKDYAEVKFTYVDVLELAEMYSTDVSADMFYQHCIDCIAAGNAPTLERTIVVSYAELTQNGKTELKVIDSFELADVMTGGVATEYYKMIGGYN